ncbi:MAG: sulfatase family protein [Saccharofermentanales bacterium]
MENSKSVISRDIDSPRPNIVLIMADQLAASFIGCYGSGVDSTPCLDELAGNGTLFSRCYATTPVCAPNRACLLTGRSPEIHGIITNNYVLQSDNPTYANVLKYHGYKCGGFGKFHQTPMSFGTPLKLDYLGFDEVAVVEDPVWSVYIDWVKENHPDCLEAALAITNSHGGVVKPNYEYEKRQGASDEDFKLKEAGFEKYMKPRMGESEWDRMYVSPLDAKADDCVFITDTGIDYMKRQHDADQPFLCHLSYIGPHDPYAAPEPYASMFSPDDMPAPIPASWTGEPGPETFYHVLDSYLNFRKIYNDEKAIAKLRAMYHGSIRMIDDQIRRVVDFLKKENLWDNTVVIFTTDHGDSMGDQGLIAKGTHHYDTCIRTPLIIGGGFAGNNGVTGRLTTTTDFFCTMCEIAGVSGDMMPPVEGASFAGLINSRFKTGFHQSVNVTISNAATVISDDGWRLTVYAGAKTRQMFNLADDPKEQHNLYYDPEYDDMKIKLMEMLINNKTRNAMMLTQYRNMPLSGGKKFNANVNNEELPVYCHSDAPWLGEGSEKFLWKSYTKL